MKRVKIERKFPGARDGGGREHRSFKRRQFVPAEELAQILATAPYIDYEQLRADLDAVADPGTRDWYDWQARNGRHVRPGGLERG